MRIWLENAAIEGRLPSLGGALRLAIQQVAGGCWSLAWAECCCKELNSAFSLVLLVFFTGGYFTGGNRTVFKNFEIL